MNKERRENPDFREAQRRVSREYDAATRDAANALPSAGMSEMVQPPNPSLAWRNVLAFQWMPELSKNKRYGRRGAQTFVNRDVKSAEELVAWRVRQSLAGVPLVHNKFWLDITAWKPSHRSDAVNLVDSLCDAVKLATPVDDNWFSLRWVDWHVDPRNPRFVLGIGQEDVEDAQVCTLCGRLKPLSSFHRDSSNQSTGRRRRCRDCIAAGRRERRRRRELEAKDREVKR